MRDILFYTFQQIGRIFNKTHATILHSYNQYPYMLKYKPELKDKYNYILKEWMGEEYNSSDTLPINLQLESLEEQNKFLKLSTNKLRKKLKLMVWANNDHQDCKYTVEDVDKIKSFKSWSSKRKVDTLLHIDCAMYTNLGLDSTIKERNEVKQKSRVIYRTIKTLDERAGKLFLQSMD
tara:strand:- start:1958 stop:2491 length:534 start_codon:yes stop_codon:yes gene_type:complete